MRRVKGPTLARAVRMSDVLSPAAQARAARWAANWLGDHGYDSHRLSGGDAVAALRWAVDELDPPETVESLRGPSGIRPWPTQIRGRTLADGWRDRAIEHRDEAERLRVEIVRLRASHVEAEAARGRCSRED